MAGWRDKGRERERERENDIGGGKRKKRREKERETWIDVTLFENLRESVSSVYVHSLMGFLLIGFSWAMKSCSDKAVLVHV